MPPDMDRRPVGGDEATMEQLFGGSDKVSIPSTSNRIAYWLAVTPDALPTIRDHRAEHLPRSEWERLIRERPCGVGARNRYEAAVIA